MEFTNNQRGNAVLTYLGFEYNKYRESDTTRLITWRCRQQKSSRCKASMKTIDDTVVEAPTSHSHDSSPQIAKANIALYNMKKGIKQVGATTKTVIENEMLGLSEDVTAHLPKQSSIARNLSRHKKNSQLPKPPTPALVIPEKYEEADGEVEEDEDHEDGNLAIEDKYLEKIYFLNNSGNAIENEMIGLSESGELAKPPTPAAAITEKYDEDDGVEEDEDHDGGILAIEERDLEKIHLLNEKHIKRKMEQEEELHQLRVKREKQAIEMERLIFLKKLEHCDPRLPSSAARNKSKRKSK